MKKTRETSGEPRPIKLREVRMPEKMKFKEWGTERDGTTAFQIRVGQEVIGFFVINDSVANEFRINRLIFDHPQKVSQVEKAQILAGFKKMAGKKQLILPEGLEL